MDALGAVASLVLCALIVLPIAWGVLLSFKDRVDALSIPPSWWFQPTLDNYRSAFVTGSNGGTVLNSIIIASASAAVAMFLAIPAAYVFSRARFRASATVFFGLLTIRMAPATVIALPLFLIFTELHLIDTYIAIVSVHAAISVSLAVWIMKGFFDEVPRQIDEASLLDGDSRLTALRRQILPVCLPGVMVTAAFCFINSWNEFFLALMLTGYTTRPLTVAIPALMTPHGTNWGQVTAISSIGLLPGLLFAFLARRYVVRELTAGAVWN